MTTIERPYWPHSDPEPPEAHVSPQTVYTAQPPSECLNGCESRQGSPASKVWCEPGQRLCPKCAARLDKWLRAIPDLYALLPHVVDHGTVPADPGTMHVKRPDPPAPMRLEVVDLLDTRSERGVLGVVHSWAEMVRDQRHDTRPCTCSHARPSHTHHCSAIGCGCHEYRPVTATVSRECAYLITNLPWCTQQEFAGDLYDEIRVLARTLADTVGEYRPKPVGKCAALVTLDMGYLHEPDLIQDVCGGALVMDREGTGVHCLRCGARHEANHELRALGLLVDRIFNPRQEAS
jgi:hypothetical protein